MKKIVFILFVVVFTSCDPVDLRLKFINTGDKLVYVELAGEDSVDLEKWVQELEKFYVDYNKDIKEDVLYSNDTMILSTIGDWGKILKDTAQYISVCVLNVAYLSTKDSIDLKEATYVYKLNLNDIKNLNWEINFRE